MLVSNGMKVAFTIMIIIAGVCGYATTDSGNANTEEPYRRYPKDGERWHDPFGVYYKDAKPADFVYLLPASVGGTIFSTIGFVVMWPGKLIWSCCNSDFSDEAMFPPIDFSSKYCGTAGCYVLGSPFWLLEKAFYEGPVWLYEQCSGDDAPAASASENKP